MSHPTTIYYRIDKHEADRALAAERRSGDPDRLQRHTYEALIGRIPAMPPYTDLGLREGLDRAQSYLCGICGKPLHNVGQKLTLEHVIPSSRGGCGWGNLVRAHGHCNNRKGDRWPTGCEMIFLAATNLRLVACMYPPTPEERRATERERQRRKRRRRAERNRVARQAAP